MNMENQIDLEKLQSKAENAFDIWGKFAIATNMHLGDHLGLYKAMRDAGPVTSESLSDKTGYHERWVREWLRGQAAAGLITYHGDGSFEMGPEEAMVLADEENPASVIGAFQFVPMVGALVNKIPTSFKTGIGHSYDSLGSDCAAMVERLLGPWYRASLVEEALPKIDGLVDKLEAGAKCVDIGCGAAVAMVTMAQAFPKSEFHGYDNSQHAFIRARANIQAAGVTNVFLHDSDEETIPTDHSYDFATALDCLHDMSHPELAVAAAREALKPDGVFFVIDIDGKESFEENLADNPLAPMSYAVSLLCCMSSSACVADGGAHGTLALPEGAMRKMVTGGGFQTFKRVDGLEHPFNAYYEARP